jgi:hypothetical protein
MASVTFARALAVDQPQSSAPAWWRRAHSYSLPVVVVGQITATWLVSRVARTPLTSSVLWYELTLAAMAGFIFAQCFLLGLWAALGGLATIPRWLIVGSVTAVGSMVVAATALTAGWQSAFEAAPEIIPSSFALMGCFAAMLLPLRRLAGWRIDFDEAYHAQAPRRGQLVTMDFAAMFCAVAFPLTLFRVVVGTFDGDGAAVLLVVTLLSLFVLAIAGPVALAVLAARRRWLWQGAAAVWIVAMAWGQSLLSQLVPDFNLVGNNSLAYLGLKLPILALHMGIALAVAAPLLVLRCCGLQWLTVGTR